MPAAPTFQAPGKGPGGGGHPSPWGGEEKLHLPFLEGPSLTPCHLPGPPEPARRAAHPSGRARPPGRGHRASGEPAPSRRRGCCGGTGDSLSRRAGLGRTPLLPTTPRRRGCNPSRPPAAPGVGPGEAGRGAGWSSPGPPEPRAAWGRVPGPRPRGGSDPGGGGAGPRARGRGGAGMEQASPGCARPRHHDAVEAWLDDHRDFAFSYFVRKGTR